MSGSLEREKREALELRDDGLSIRQIAAELGVPRSTVADWLATGRNKPDAAPDTQPSARPDAPDTP